MIETPLGTRRRREVLNQAARLIEKRGYTHGSKGMPSSYEFKGQVCILGAVALAAGFKPETGEWDDYDLALNVIGEGQTSGDYYNWNDQLRHHFIPERRAPIIARCLRFMAKGLPFSEAKRQAEKAETT